jgi:isocitrate dehydrogenase
METVGVDVFLNHEDRNADTLGNAREKVWTSANLELTMITNRGVKVWPNGMRETFCTDHWRCRYKHPEGKAISYNDILEISQKVHSAGYKIIKTENLCNIDGQAAYSAGQGA